MLNFTILGPRGGPRDPPRGGALGGPRGPPPESGRGGKRFKIQQNSKRLINITQRYKIQRGAKRPRPGARGGGVARLGRVLAHFMDSW